jgi:tetratricopeptide (TPR) repeat protein
MLCEKCGNELSDAAGFCGQCGAPNPALRQSDGRDDVQKEDEEAVSAYSPPVDDGKSDGDSNPTPKTKSPLGGKRKYAVFAAAGLLLVIAITVAVVASSTEKAPVVASGGRVSDGDAEFDESYQLTTAQSDIAKITASADSAISGGDCVKALKALRTGLTKYPEDETLLRAYDEAESAYMSDFNKRYSELAGEKKYSELISAAVEATTVLPDNTVAAGKLESAKTAYKVSVLSETEAAAASGDHKAAYELLVAAMPFPDNDKELSGAMEREGAAYRSSALSEASLVYKDTGGDYHAAIAVIDAALQLLENDSELADAKADYENFSPVAIIKNGGITSEMPAASLVPHTREEANEILRMLYINNLNSNDPPVIRRSPNAEANTLLRNTESALSDTKSTAPFLTDMWGEIEIIEDKYLSYEMCSNYFLSRNGTDVKGIDVDDIDELFFDKPFIGKKYDSSFRAKLGTDFSYSLGSLWHSYSGLGYTGYTYFTTWEIFSGEYQYNLDPAMKKSGDITHFEVNTTDDYIYFVSDADDAAILFFDSDDDGQMYAQGIIADKNRESSYVSIRYIWLE